MALPPEPLAVLLEAADAVVVGHVDRVTATGAEPPQKHAPRGKVDVGNLAARQTLVLVVDRVLKAGLSLQTGASIVVVKPESPILLDSGHQGPFFLAGDGDGDVIILGRYGPDTHKLPAIEAALASAR